MRPTSPVEYVVIGFPGNQFTGGIAPALANLVESGTVRILDLVFIKRDADDNVFSFEYDDLAETAAYGDIDGDADGFLDEEDIIAAAEQLAPDSSAMLIVWEDLWAKQLADELFASGGEVLAGSRIPRALVNDIFDAIEGNPS